MAENRACIVSGSFDPITLGHIDIIQRSLRLFDRVVLAIMCSESKRPMFELPQRERLARAAMKNFANVEIVIHEGLLVELAKELGIHTVVRGMRTGVDFSYENQMASINAALDPELETVFLISKFAHITSSSVREILHFGGDVSAFVDENTNEEIKSILRTR